jgi:two-component system LytT family response regulator
MPSTRAHLNVLIVEDEPNARAGLARMLARHDDLRVVGECGDGASAIKAIRALTPDLVLLDVQMPPPDGLAVVRAIGPERMPPVVFVTAHDRFAVAAFEAHAVDYVLKPFSEQRLLQAIRRAGALLESRRMEELAHRLAGVLGAAAGDGAAAAAAGTEERIVVRSLGRAVVVPVADLVRVEAAGYYVRLHTRTRTLLHREPLDALEARLPADRFLRVHRSELVHVGWIREAVVTARGEHELVLGDGGRVGVSRSRWPVVAATLRRWGGAAT